jgi:membrane-bound lytic murein transglycosylase D
MHDRDYPLIIYTKIKINKTSYRQTSKSINNEKSTIKELLTMIRTQPESAWSPEARRIATLFKTYAPDSALNNAEERIRFQQGQKERFKEGLYRSGAYIDTIKKIFAQFNIPQRLAYLPHVESSFNPDAYSKVGAAGLWQFMRSTGKLFLHINYYIDERRDPILSTYAAAKLLFMNYNQLQSWPLAITAYNHGLNGMKRAVIETGTRDINTIITRHSSASFRFASKNFYSCFLAASEIALNTSQYFPDITYASPIKYQDVTLDYYISPTILASNINLSLERLEELNPAIRPAILKNNKLIPKGTTIHIPYSVNVAFAKKAIDNIPDSLKITTQPAADFYRVHFGDNLYTIARFLEISPKDLAMENNITLKNRIYAGQVLRVPSKAGLSKPLQVAAVTKTPQKQAAPLPAHTPEPAVKKETLQVRINTAETAKAVPAALGDTLKAILMAKADTIPLTTVIKEPNLSSQFDASIYDLDVTFTPQTKTAAIRIAVNETIGHFADWLDITATQIRILNHMGRGSTIRINQKLAIPIQDSAALEKFNTRRLEYHMALEEDFYNQYKVVDVRQHFIEKGENLWDICNGEDQIPLWLFKKYNKNLDLEQLSLQTRIYIPVIEEKPENSPGQDYDASFMFLPDFPSRPFQTSP